MKIPAYIAGAFFIAAALIGLEDSSAEFTATATLAVVCFIWAEVMK